MKLVGVSVASLALTRCRFIPATCYAPMPPSPYPTEPVSVRDRLRACWLRFDELVQKTQEESAQGVTENTFGQQLVAEHRLALDELIAAGQLTSAVASLVQEAYEAAVYHVWRSNAPMTCYAPVIVDYGPTSAGVLIQQSEVLNEIASQGTVAPQTLENARTALEHDMAYYDLSADEVNSLYERIITEWQTQGQTAPAFEDVELEITPDAKAAAEFIIGLLTEK